MASGAFAAAGSTSWRSAPVPPPLEPTNASTNAGMSGPGESVPSAFASFDAPPLPPSGGGGDGGGGGGGGWSRRRRRGRGGGGTERREASRISGRRRRGARVSPRSARTLDRSRLNPRRDPPAPRTTSPREAGSHPSTPISAQLWHSRRRSCRMRLRRIRREKTRRQLRRRSVGPIPSVVDRSAPRDPPAIPSAVDRSAPRASPAGPPRDPPRSTKTCSRAPSTRRRPRRPGSGGWTRRRRSAGIRPSSGLKASAAVAADRPRSSRRRARFPTADGWRRLCLVRHARARAGGWRRLCLVRRARARAGGR